MTLRGTIYVIDDHDREAAPTIHRAVVSYNVDSPHAFQLQAFDDIRASRLPGHAPPRVEFGPIAEPWGLR